MPLGSDVRKHEQLGDDAVARTERESARSRSSLGRCDRMSIAITMRLSERTKDADVQTRVKNDI